MWMILFLLFTPCPSLPLYLSFPRVSLALPSPTKPTITIQTDRPSPSLHTALLLSYFLLHLHPPHPLTLTRELEWPTRVPPTA